MIKEMGKELSLIIEKQVVRLGGIWKWIKNVFNGQLWYYLC
jgi:hypothetical protein